MSSRAKGNVADSSASRLVERLAAIRHRFEPADTIEKVRLLRTIRPQGLRQPAALVHLYDALCYLRAFPDHPDVLQAATQADEALRRRLSKLSASLRRKLVDSGLPFTSVQYEFSRAVAAQLCVACPNDLRIDWKRCEDPEKIDQILLRIIADAETQTFDDGEESTRAWMRRAIADPLASDLHWLLRQLDASRISDAERDMIFEAATIPVSWRLRTGRGCMVVDAGRTPKPYFHQRNLLKRVAAPRREITRPMRRIRRVPRHEADAWIRAAIMALAVRQREVHAMTYANRDEVYVADVGRGMEVIVYGVVPSHRLTLEGNYGYMVFKDRLAMAYGGGSPLFRQANTGINVFPEYRGGEAAFAFVQVLRTLHALFGCERFIANPYQFGDDNKEAIDSAAFWFYYKLGFRPIDPAVRRLARGEWRRLRSGRGVRSSPKVLKQLARGDLTLTLPGARSSSHYPEANLGICAAGVTDLLAAHRVPLRSQAIRQCIRDVARQLDAAGRETWPIEDRAGFDRLAPLVALVADIHRWTASHRRGLVALMRAKNRKQEREYVRLLSKSDRLRRALCDYCRAHATSEKRRIEAHPPRSHGPSRNTGNPGNSP